MKKSIILSFIAVTSLGLAACGEKASSEASNAEIELNDTMESVSNDVLEATPAPVNMTEVVEEKKDVAQDAADAASQAAAAAAEAAANHM